MNAVESAAQSASLGKSTQTIHEAVIAAWPEHAGYLEKSVAARTPEMLEITEVLAEAALTLAGPRLPEIAAHYRWTCDRLRDEELFFHRHGHYRLRMFAEADREVYSNAEYMEKYMDGLLLSQVLWYNHTASVSFFLAEARKFLPEGATYLEIGPGHGLMMYLALREFDLARATAWDLSPVSIALSKTALAKLGYGQAAFAVRDLTQVRAGDESFDLVVLSEVLEHLEDPASALRHVRNLVADGGILFVNVPINSPSPDHLYLLETPEEARALLTGAGFSIVSEGLFPTQGAKLERALRNRVSVSACMFARPAPADR